MCRWSYSQSSCHQTSSSLQQDQMIDLLTLSKFSNLLIHRNVVATVKIEPMLILIWTKLLLFRPLLSKNHWINLSHCVPVCKKNVWNLLGRCFICFYLWVRSLNVYLRAIFLMFCIIRIKMSFARHSVDKINALANLKIKSCFFISRIWTFFVLIK